ncbi:histidine-specific methyltransferase [Scleroderma yunnanense]
MQEPGKCNLKIHILDVRHRHRSSSVDTVRELADRIAKGLDAPFNKKTLPSMILYDEVGLLLYDKFSAETPEYYPFGAEMEILKMRADEIVQVMHVRSNSAIVPGEVVVELGAGSLRKTSHLLRALSNIVPIPSHVPPVTYFALDLDESELRRTLNEIHISDIGPSLAGKGTYESGLEFIVVRKLGSSGQEDECAPFRPAFGPDITSARPGHLPLHLFFLGGTIGSFHRGEDAHHDNKREELELTYDNPKGHNKVFVLNGLDVAGKTLGSPGLFDRDNWDFFRHYDEDKRCIEGFYKCLRSYEISLPGYNRSVQFLQGEFVQVTVSTKYSESDISALLADAQLKPIQHWVDSTNRHSLWLLERPLITTAQSPFA